MVATGLAVRACQYEACTAGAVTTGVVIELLRAFTAAPPSCVARQAGLVIKAFRGRLRHTSLNRPTCFRQAEFPDLRAARQAGMNQRCRSSSTSSDSPCAASFAGPRPGMAASSSSDEGWCSASACRSGAATARSWKKTSRWPTPRSI